MAYKRMVVRCFHSSDLDGRQQQSYADEVQTRLDGTGINGYFITIKNGNWIEWEGDKSTVEAKVNEHVSDSRVSNYEIVEAEEVSSLDWDKWRAHTEPDLHCELN